LRKWNYDLCKSISRTAATAARLAEVLAISGRSSIDYSDSLWHQESEGEALKPLGFLEEKSPIFFDPYYFITIF
jgi:hypothetical protein